MGNSFKKEKNKLLARNKQLKQVINELRSIQNEKKEHKLKIQTLRRSNVLISVDELQQMGKKLIDLKDQESKLIKLVNTMDILSTDNIANRLKNIKQNKEKNYPNYISYSEFETLMCENVICDDVICDDVICDDEIGIYGEIAFSTDDLGNIDDSFGGNMNDVELRERDEDLERRLANLRGV